MRYSLVLLSGLGLLVCAARPGQLPSNEPRIHACLFLLKRNRRREIPHASFSKVSTYVSHVEGDLQVPGEGVVELRIECEDFEKVVSVDPVEVAVRQSADVRGTFTNVRMNAWIFSEDIILPYVTIRNPFNIPQVQYHEPDAKPTTHLI